MLRADVNVIGTISRSAVMRTDKRGNSYLAFGMSVNLKSSDGTQTPVTVFVNVPDGQQIDMAVYTEGKRIVVNGTMDIHKKNDNLTFFLEAKHIVTDGVGEEDGISGILHFRGHLRNENVYEERTSKSSGKPFLRFSGYSAEKDGDNFVSTWVSFLRFPEGEAGIDSIKDDCLQPKAHLQIRGTLELDVYKGKININSRVLEMSKYVKPDYPQA